MHRPTALTIFGAIMALSTLTLNAQVTAPGRTYALPRFEASATYSLMRSNAGPGQCGCFYMTGGSAEFAWHAYRGISLVGDLTGEHSGKVNLPNQQLSMLMYTAGPRINYRLGGERFDRFDVFGQFLVGAAYGFDALFPGSGPIAPDTATSFALLTGGGFDVRLSRHFSARAIQADYGMTKFPNGAQNKQNLIRISTGIVYRFR